VEPARGPARREALRDELGHRALARGQVVRVRDQRRQLRGAGSLEDDRRPRAGAVECSTSLKQWRPALCTNLTGSIQVARAVVPHLGAQGGGRI
jgi:NAD(P)-dependent dehydrogenase (short-subunit alcohol dehydrogenase family)